MSQHVTSVIDPKVAELLRSGAIAVIPTDTVYGLVAAAYDERAVARLYATKPRELSPGTLIAASVEQLVELGFVADDVVRAAQYWPAAVSVVINATNVADYLKRTRTSLAVRIPDDAALQALLTEVGPLMTTSANAPKQPTATTIDEAYEYFGDAVDVYVDVGHITDRPASTIIGFDARGRVEVYRQGAVDVGV